MLLWSSLLHHRFRHSEGTQGVRQHYQGLCQKVQDLPVCWWCTRVPLSAQRVTRFPQQAPWGCAFPPLVSLSYQHLATSVTSCAISVLCFLSASVNFNFPLWTDNRVLGLRVCPIPWWLRSASCLCAGFASRTLFCKGKRWLLRQRHHQHAQRSGTTRGDARGHAASGGEPPRSSSPASCGVLPSRRWNRLLLRS